MSAADSISEEILSALARADELLADGSGPEEVFRVLQVSRETYRIWRLAQSRTAVATARRLRALERIQTELLEQIAEQRVMILQLTAQV